MVVDLCVKNSLVPEDELQELLERLRAETARMQAAVNEGYSTEYASISLPGDEKFLAQSRTLASSLGKVDAIIVIGIGGSNLGTLAVHEACNGKYHNGIRGPRIFFADTVDADSIRDIASFIDAYLTHNMRVVLNVISKSGGTTETVANFEIFLQLFAKHHVDPAPNVVVTSDEGSPLWQLAQKQQFHTLPIPKNVGGRFSVFSNVGLFPLTLLGLDCSEMLHGARDMREQCLQPRCIAQDLAAAHFHHAQHGRNIADLFLFSNDLESLGKWYRQLIGESLGKEMDRDGKQVWSGVTPTVSIGSTDLHSMGQLYLGGPQDKFTTFVSLEQVSDTAVPAMPAYEQLVPHLQGRTLSNLMDAIKQGVQAAYRAQQRPYADIILTSKSLYDIGAFMQLQMMQVIYLAALMGVNPFDQPHVELYKKETKRILGGREKVE